MSKHAGISSVLAAAASLLVMGMVVAGSPAQAASEEDLAAPHGSFVSTLAVPHDAAAFVYRAADRTALIVASEEDAAVPQGSFTSTMTAPGDNAVRLAAAEPDAGLPEIVAAGLE